VCEEFHCLPAEAIDAIQNDVGGLLFRIMDLRTYARAKDVYDSTPMEKRPKSRLMDKVAEIKFGFARERMERLKRQAE